jgi:hypothetical protein
MPALKVSPMREPNVTARKDWSCLAGDTFAERAAPTVGHINPFKIKTATTSTMMPTPLGHMDTNSIHRHTEVASTVNSTWVGKWSPMGPARIKPKVSAAEDRVFIREVDLGVHPNAESCSNAASNAQ